MDEIRDKFAELLENHDWNYAVDADNLTRFEKGLNSHVEIFKYYIKYPEYQDMMIQMMDEANPNINNKTII